MHVFDDAVVKDHSPRDLGHPPYHATPADGGLLDACPFFNSSRVYSTRVGRNLSLGIDQRSFRRRSDLILNFLLQGLHRNCQQFPPAVILNIPLLSGC